MALVPEGRQLFAQMTRGREPGARRLAGAQGASAPRACEQVFNDFPKLRERAQQLAGTMSGGEQQMVAVARAMMSAPRLLMLDEPSLGLAPRMVDELLAIARRIADAGTTVLMVEQNVKQGAGRGRPRLRAGARHAGGQRAGEAAGALHRRARGLSRRREQRHHHRRARRQATQSPS